MAPKENYEYDYNVTYITSGKRQDANLSHFSTRGAQIKLPA